MSSDENEIFNRNPKNKVCPLPDSSRSSSDGSPIIGSSSSGFKRRNVRALNESSASVSSNSPEIVFKRKKTARLETDSDFSTDDNLRSNRKKRLIHRRNVLLSDSGDSDSDLSSIIVPRRMRNHLIMSDSEDSDQWESDFSDEASYFDGNNAGTSVLPEEKSIESDSSDGQSEKCPICLLSFRLQEVGIPENCEHTFCLECLQEWSKNMNTCPVDRKEYHSITVKKLLNGKFMRKIPIERPAVQDDSVNIIEDPTFCQICGSSGDEDRMLLCDECDLGFHLYCLDPPLSDVPEGSWFCSQCVPMERVNLRMGLNAVMNWINVAESLVDSSTQPERRTSLR